MPSLPRSILADAGPIVAIIRADDAHHARAKAFGRSYTGKLITTWPVIAEAAHLLGRQGRATLLEMILDGFLVVEDVSAADTDRMRTMLRRYETMDLGDASLVAVGERLGILDVITVDRRDFAACRTRSGRAFVNHFPKATYEINRRRRRRFDQRRALERAISTNPSTGALALSSNFLRGRRYLPGFSLFVRDDPHGGGSRSAENPPIHIRRLRRGRRISVCIQA